MIAVFILLINLIDKSRIISELNIPLLILTLIILITALTISIHISKKNKLYINYEKQEAQTRIYKGEEVVS